MNFHSLWGSVERLSWLITLANWGVAATLLVAFACTVIAIKASSRKDELTSVEDLRKAGQIANLENANLTLRGQVANLEINAATANKDLAVLQKAAADAKTAQQKVEIDLAKQQERAAIAERSLLELQEKIKPRRLLEAQKQALVRLLSSEIPMAPRILCAFDAPDGEVFKDDFVDVFRRLGWTVSPNNTGRGQFSPHIIGILIVVKNGTNAPSQAGAVQRALKAIGIEASGGIDNGLPDNTFEIRIGSKE